MRKALFIAIWFGIFGVLLGCCTGVAMAAISSAVSRSFDVVLLMNALLMGLMVLLCIVGGMVLRQLNFIWVEMQDFQIRTQAILTSHCDERHHVERIESNHRYVSKPQVQVSEVNS